MDQRKITWTDHLAVMQQRAAGHGLPQLPHPIAATLNDRGTHLLRYRRVVNGCRPAAYEVMAWLQVTCSQRPQVTVIYVLASDWDVLRAAPPVRERAAA